MKAACIFLIASLAMGDILVAAEFEEGDVCKLQEMFVQSVLAEDTLRARTWNGHPVVLTGIDTTGMGPGTFLEPDNWFVCVKYVLMRNESGEGASLPLFRMLTNEEVARHRALQQQAIERAQADEDLRKAQAADAADASKAAHELAMTKKPTIWRSGEFECRATFVSLEGDTLTLKRLDDGRLIKIDVTILDTASQVRAARFQKWVEQARARNPPEADAAVSGSQNVRGAHQRLSSFLESKCPKDTAEYRLGTALVNGKRDVREVWDEVFHDGTRSQFEQMEAFARILLKLNSHLAPEGIKVTNIEVNVIDVVLLNK